MSVMDLYIAKMERQLDDWTATLAAMKTKLDDSELQGRLEFHSQLDASQRQHELACRHLDELKQSGEEAWQTLKSGVEAAWKELATSVREEIT